MAQTGYTPISIYYSATATNTPTAGNLVAGELAINTADGKLFYKDSSGVVQTIAGKGGAGVAGGSTTQVQYNSSGSLAGSANMTFSGTALTLANDASISGLTVGKGGGSATGATVLGYQALNTNSAGTYNTAVGYQSLFTNTAAQNSAFGAGSLYANTTGTLNTALGQDSLAGNTTGGSNAASGRASLTSNTTGSFNSAFGTDALRLNTTASNNTAVGYQAGYAITTGSNNVLMGYYGGIGGAGSALTTATANTFIGPSAGYLVTTGSKNTFLGAFSGNSGSLDLRTSSNNIVLSDGDGNPRGVFDGSGNLSVGRTASLARITAETTTDECIFAINSAGASSATMASWNNASTGNNYLHAFFVDAGGSNVGNIDYLRSAGLVRYNTTSDATLKNIIGDSNGQRSLEILNTTRIREFAWKNDTEQKPQIGVIAQELYETYKGAVSVGGENDKGEYRPWGVDKTAFTFHLIAGWQAHEKLIQELNAKIIALENK